MIATSSVSIVNVNDGATGATGPQGVSVTKVVEEYRLSNSSTELTGSGTGYTWSETKPDIPSGKYLWIRERTDLSNNTSSYGTAHCDIVISGLVQDVDRNSGVITSKVWESYTQNSINEYDGSTGAAIRDRVTQTETSITGITSRVSDVESETDSLGTRMTSAESSITQNANNIALKVSQDGVISSINQSPETVKISASKVNIEGAVTFSSFDSTLQNRLTTAESDASTAKSNASSAVSTANTASSNASSALTKVNNSIKSTTMHYLATSASSGVTTSTSGWTTTIQSITKDKPYLWTYQTVTKINDTTSNTDPVISGVYGATGGKGDTGTGVTKVEQLYRTSNSTTAPAAPTSAVSSTSTSYNTWTLAMPTYNTSYPYYYICTQTTYDNGTVKWTTVSRSKALEDANSTANTANTNASNAVSTANTANTNASNAVSTANTANTNASNAVTTANQAKSKADSAASLLSTWTGDATLATTTINGGYIKTHTIESTHLATNAIMSQNYTGLDNSHFSSEGSYLDLSTGNFYTPKFGVSAEGQGGAYINGEVVATSGRFGNDTSYWNIATVYDYNSQPHASLVGTGSPYLQTGNWQVSDNAVATRKYTSTSESAGNATYYKDSDTNTFYDVGMKIPTDFSSTAATNDVGRYNKAFYYGRKYTGNNPPTVEGNWVYFYMLDTSGNLKTAGTITTGGDIYEGGTKLSEKYAAISDVGSVYLPKTGGTITGNLTVNGSFTTNLQLQTNLGSTSSAQLTGAANAVVKPGVTGTLGVGNGGTGKSSWTANQIVYASASNTLSQLGSGTSGQILKSNGSSAPSWVNQSTLSVGSATKATQDGNGNVITDTYRTLDNNQFDTIDITDAQVGNLIVTGAGRFTNGLYGDLIGNADTATTATTANKVGSNLVILLNSGTTEGTNKFTYNGSATKNVNITKSAIGLGNVDNTADANKTVKEAGKVTNTLKIQLNGGTTEGTNQFSYNGSAAKNINITKSSVGLGNVENTALSTWAGSANLTTTKVGTLAAAAAKGVDTSISTASSSANLPTSEAVAAFVEGKGYATSTEVATFVEDKGYVTSSGVTSVRVQATSPVVSSVNTAQSSTLNTTISLANGYGDTKNPYGTKTKNYVLAGPSSGDAAAPTFRALVAADIPTLTPAKAGLGNVTNNKQVKGLSSGTTSGHLVSWGSDGYTVADSGIATTSVTTKIKLAETDYSVSSNTITITQENLQSAVQSTGLVLMTSAERSKLESIQVSEGGTIDFSGVTASSPLTATVATNKTVNITHNTSGVSAGTYRSVTVNTYGHVTAGTNPTTLSGYGITDAKIASGTITLGSNTITPLTANSTLNAAKLSGTASISTTGNATTATKFSSNRSITLTGDVVGTSSSNGENGWSLTTAIVDDSHNHTTETIVPLQTKTYTGVIASANDEAKGQLYFIKVQPDAYGGQWSIHYKVTATIDGVSAANGNGYETSDVYLSGMRDTYSGYRTWNDITNTSYRPYYYHCFYRAKEAGINGGYGHAIGINLRYSYNPTTAANTRTVTFEIIKTEGCTVTLLDAPLIYANWPGTGSTNYNTYNNFDATTQGNTMSGDRNDVNYYNRNYYGSRTAAANIYRYQLCLTKKDRSLLPINSVNNDVSTNKSLTTESFDPFGDILYWSSTTTYSAGANVGDGWYAQYLADIRYSFNIGGYNTTSTLVGRKPLYLVATPQADGTAVLHSSPLAQDLPTTEDGLIYIYLGQVYQDTHPYRLYLTILHPIYWYKNGAVRQYIQTSEKALQDGNGAVIASTYAKLSGATFTGAVNTANGTWNTIGDDAYLGDINKGGHIGIKGKNGNTGLFFVTYNQNSNTTGGAITWDGTKFSITGTVDTSISGNATTATTATTANSIKNLGRKENLDIDNTDDQYKNKVTYMLASSSTTTGKPPIDGGVLNFAWDGNRWGAQLAIKIDTTPHMYIRGNNNSDWDASWLTVLDSNNYNTYAPKKDGTGATGTWGISITGSATKATQDSDGNAINTTYMKKSGGAFTGAVTGTSFAASSYLSANSTNSGTAGGLALWSTDPTAYGIMLRTTANQGKHGYVQGEYAAYLTMSGATASAAETRGWVFKNKMANECVASISALGHAVFNGSVTVGGNAANTSGCRMVVNESTNSLDFIWN